MIARLIAGTTLLAALSLAACSSSPELGLPMAQPRTIDDSPQALKIGISRAGIYRVEIEDLQARGLLPSGALLDRAALYQDGNLVATWNDPSGQALIFHGLPPSSRYAPFAFYVLRWDSGGGRVVPTEGLPPAATGPAAAARAILRFEENAIYLPRAVEAVSDPWFWARLVPGSPVDLSFQVPAVGEGRASLTASLWGASASQELEPDHRVMVSLNGVQLGQLAWDGENVGARSWTFSSNILTAGDNQLDLAILGDTGNWADLSYLDWITVTFPVATTGVADPLVVTVGPGRLMADPDNVILDLSDPRFPVHLDVPTQGGLLDSERVIALVPPEGGFEPDLVAPMTDSDWASGDHQADYLILAPAVFSRTLAPLVSARHAQGLATLLVPVEELGDEFGGGAVTPDALHRFLVHVVETWAGPAPRYLLLVGDVSYDFRNYLGQGQQYLVPSMAIPVAFGGETLSDTRLADLDDDGRPEMAVGRWPVSDEAQLVALVQRTLEYEKPGAMTQRALFVADTSESTFTAMSDRLIDIAAQRSVAVRLYGVTNHETVQAWNQGAWLINYVGHGSLDLWGKAALLDIASLDNLRSIERPPIVTQFTCLTGFFGHPQLISLSEAMLRAQNGPVATIAATSLTLAANQELFAAAFLAQLADPETFRIGDALLRAQRLPGLDTGGGQEVVATFHLLGDPALVIARPD
jgi:hypothetical protein